MPGIKNIIGAVNRARSVVGGGMSGLNRAERFLLVGTGISVFNAIKHRTYDRALVGNPFTRPGAQISDPYAANGFRPGAPTALTPAPSFQANTQASLEAFSSARRHNLPRVATKMFGMPAAAGITTVGAIVGLSTLLATRRPGLAAGAALASGIGGGVLGFRLAAGTTAVMSNVARAYYGLGGQKVDNTAYGGGKGFRTWYKRPGGRLSPGHMGADGTLPLAMHKIRNRSIRV